MCVCVLCGDDEYNRHTIELLHRYWPREYVIFISLLSSNGHWNILSFLRFVDTGYRYRCIFFLNRAQNLWNRFRFDWKFVFWISCEPFNRFHFLLFTSDFGTIEAIASIFDFFSSFVLKSHHLIVNQLVDRGKYSFRTQLKQFTLQFGLNPMYAIVCIYANLTYYRSLCFSQKKNVNYDRRKLSHANSIAHTNMGKGKKIHPLHSIYAFKIICSYHESQLNKRIEEKRALSFTRPTIIFAGMQSFWLPHCLNP